MNVKATHGNTAPNGGVVSCGGGYRFHDECVKKVDVKVAMRGNVKSFYVIVNGSMQNNFDCCNHVT
jgi:hypothetical protein